MGSFTTGGGGGWPGRRRTQGIMPHTAMGTDLGSPDSCNTGRLAQLGALDQLMIVAQAGQAPVVFLALHMPGAWTHV